MATKKDLVEAYSFSRRRLVTAFVSGAPGGREVEPARPGRVIVGGVALAVLLVAGAAVAGVLKPRADADWQEKALVTDERGALYVLLDESPGEPRLRSIINVTSAQLIVGSEEKATTVPAEEIEGEPKGPPIGILGAPATVPTEGQLINDGWTSCTGHGLGIKTDVSGDERVTPDPRRGFVVRDARTGRVHLIANAPASGGLPARAYRYRMPEGDERIYPALGLSTTPSEAITVPSRWLQLFPEGGALDVAGLGFAGWGRRIPAALRDHGYPAGARVGDWFTNDNGRVAALTARGPVQLTEFAAAVLLNTPLGRGRPVEVDVPAAADVVFVPRPFEASHWPQGLVAGSPTRDEQVCAVLDTEEGEAPAIRLAVAPQGSAGAEDVAPSMREVTVASGHGALVRSADWISAEGGAVHLVDDRGFSYAVAGAEEVSALGYGGVPELVVPDVWNKLFADGPELSRDAALCPPASPGSADRARSCS